MQKKYRVEITAVAESDIQEIFQYIVVDNKASAVKLVNEIERQINSLERYPSRYAVIPESQDLGRKYRHIIYGNYRTIYKIEGLKVIIMRVIHSARLLSLEIFEK